jgi:signal transduction histidine kinase
VGEAIHEAFVIPGSPGHRWAVSRIGALVGTILGAGIGFAILTAGSATATQRVGAAAAGLAGIVAGQVLMRSSLPLWVLDVALVGASATLGMVGAQGGPLYVLLPPVFVSLGASVFVVRSLRRSLQQLAAVGAAYGYALAAGPPVVDPLTWWVAVMGAILIAGLFARRLVQRVTTLATAEHEARLDAERSTTELEGQSQLKTAFLARMSHELRTPLNAVVGFADVLRDGLVGPLNEQQHQYVQDIAGSGRDLLLLVDELLDVSKVESGVLDLDVHRVDIAEAVEDAEVLVQVRARDAGVTIEVTRPPTAVVAEADALRIRQVAWNLLGNAVKFTPRGGSVRVVVLATAELVRVAVRDTGPGVDPSEQDRIFERYEQGEHDVQGSGIGLALSRRLIEAHGGQLLVESTPGQGATFTFELPRRQERRGREAHPAAPEAVAPLSPGEPEATPWLDLDQAIMIPGSRAARAAVAMVGQWFCLWAAMLLPLLALITPGRVAVRAAVIALSLVSLLVFRFLRHRAPVLPDRTIDGLGLSGTILVSLGVLVSGTFAPIVALAYGWNVLASSALLSARRAMVQFAVDSGAYAIVLAVSRPPDVLEHWLGVAMMLCAHGVVISWVSGRLREAMTEALVARVAAEASRAEVESVSAHKSDFLANTSHELCTPLNAIIGFTQVLQDELIGPLEPRQASYLEDILESGQHLLALITDLLDLAKLEAGRLPWSPQPTSIEALVGTAVAEVAPAATRRDIHIDVELAADLPTITTDPGHLHHALANLLANAVKFSSDGGRVEVVARGRGGEVRLTVRDNGMGILPEQLPHLFEAFHQGTRPLPAHARGGTGLGLTLAKGLVEVAGGRITVDSTPGVGSTFTIVLGAAVPTSPVREEATA